MGTVAAEVVLNDDDERHASHARGADAAPTNTLFFCTGFSRFHGVAVNPTEQLMRELGSFTRSMPRLPEHAVLASTSVLKVAAESVRCELDALYARIGDSTRPARRVLIHFGVNASSTRFALERSARNEATFTCPDEFGWTPILQPIDPSFGAISATRACRLPLDEIASDLCTRGFDVGVSNDAGRFVCNWLYFNSLTRAAKHDAYALFVHVPPLSVTPLDQQLRFAKALINCVADLHRVERRVLVEA